jgi:hypothetical protein
VTTLNGLPAHILLVHAIVVLLPLAAGMLVLTAVWPSVRRRLAGPNALLSLGVLALVPITTDAGEWLERHVPSSKLVHDHTELGDTALYVTVPVVTLALIVWWRNREEAATGRILLAPASRAVTIVIAAMAVLAAASAVYDTYRIGDSGAKASWTGNFSLTAAEVGPGRPDGPLAGSPRVHRRRHGGDSKTAVARAYPADSSVALARARLFNMG